jgi:hypothetical protein
MESPVFFKEMRGERESAWEDVQSSSEESMTDHSLGVREIAPRFRHSGGAQRNPE